MFSISELKNIAITRKEAQEIKDKKESAKLKEELEKCRLKFIKYIEDQIIIAMKRNKNEVGLNIYEITGTLKDTIAEIDKYDVELLLTYIHSPNNPACNPFTITIKEFAISIREELIKGGIREIKDGKRWTGGNALYLVF